jgi:hypothetical protein
MLDDMNMSLALLLGSFSVGLPLTIHTCLCDIGGHLSLQHADKIREGSPLERLDWHPFVHHSHVLRSAGLLSPDLQRTHGESAVHI